MQVQGGRIRSQEGHCCLDCHILLIMWDNWQSSALQKKGPCENEDKQLPLATKGEMLTTETCKGR